MLHFTVVKITFEAEDGAPAMDRKEMASFLEKIRARFRVVAMPVAIGSDDGYTAFAYTSLAVSSEALTKQMDAISAFCEEQGHGRISDEAVLMDDIESIGDDIDENEDHGEFEQ